MTQISRFPLQKEVEKRVYEILMESVAAARSEETVKKLIDDLLSPTERLMIAKRLSIALLLIKKYDQRTISNWLKASLGTVSKVSVILQNGCGGYALVLESILKDEKLRGIAERIDDTLANLFPPANRNWTHWRRERWQDKMERKKPF